MIVIFLFASICFSQCFSQQNNAIKQSDQTEAGDIIRKARQAIGLDKSGEVSSYFYKSKKTILLKNSSSFESTEEINLKLPGKIQVVYRSGLPYLAQLTRTWNGEKYKSTLETESSGQRTITDNTVQENRTQ
jgi:hypothetical protein